MEKRHDTTVRKPHLSPPDKKQKSADDFYGTRKQAVSLEHSSLFPERYEKIFLAIYFISLPYILGLIFFFFYVAEGKLDVFIAVNQDSPFLMVWAIGYEILAIILLVWIFKNSISISRRRDPQKK